MAAPSTGAPRSGLRAGYRGPAAADTPARWLEAFFIVAFILAIEGFNMQLAGLNPALPPPPGASSALSQGVLSVIYLIAGVILVRSPNFVPILSWAWPVFTLPTLALVSTLWSIDPGLTARRAFALHGTVVCGLSLAATFGPKGSIGVIIRALTLSMLLSIAFALFYSRYGVHQASDAVEALHAGRWRGIWNHKNGLGVVAGVTVSLILIFGQHAFRHWLVRGAAFGVALLCLVMSGSGAGLVLAALLTGLGAALVFLTWQSLCLRPALFASIVAAALLVAVFSQDLTNLALTLLGKDPTLTGRTVYWGYVLALMDGRWALGYGFSAGGEEIQRVVQSAIGSSLPTTHNGYLDCLVCFGFVGLAIAIIYLTWLASFALRKLFSPDVRVVQLFPLCLVAFAIVHNFVESSLVEPNGIVPTVLAVAAGLLAYDAAYRQRAAAAAPAMRRTAPITMDERAFRQRGRYRRNR